MGESRDHAALVRWQHRNGAPAYCLGRLVIRPGLERPVVVLSELAGNPDAVGLITDFPGAVPAALAALDPTLDSQSVLWLAHHGAFSSYDAAGAPETFTAVRVRFDGNYRSDLIDQRLLPPEETDPLRQLLDLAPVPQVLSSIDPDLTP
jgi:hypothetical protein